jgi:2-succinyl-5-enolpyruvyl-6-hydroxy-3-cyclohexene-1-carboxylate synthase
LNAPFRDPLAPIEDDTAKALAAADWAGFFDAENPSPACRANRTDDTEIVFAAEPGGKRGLVIAGNDWAHESIDGLFAATGWPVLADALSPARLRAGGGGERGGAVVCAAYDAILRDPQAAKALQPELVVVLGELPTSKTLRSWLTAIDVEMVYVTGRTGNRDSLHGRSRMRVLRADEATAASFGCVRPADPAWSQAWARAEAAAQTVLSAATDEPGFEGGFTRAVAETLTHDQVIFVASSMPVRDLEYFAPVRADGPRVLANRGANGIDGTLSTALGVAQAGAPTVLLTGDLALLHDTNGFLVSAKLRGSLTVVLINNDGGGIFGHLPVAKFNPPFEEYWATPQRVDFAKLCAA